MILFDEIAQICVGAELATLWHLFFLPQGLQGTGISDVWGLHLTGVNLGDGSSSCRHSLSQIRGGISGLVPDRFGLPGLPGMAAVACGLCLSGLRPKWRLAAWRRRGARRREPRYTGQPLQQPRTLAASHSTARVAPPSDHSSRIYGQDRGAASDERCSPACWRMSEWPNRS